jgi:GxxExxY protein
MQSKETLNRLSNMVIGCAIEVHKVLGPGLLESAYQQCLAWEFRQQGLSVKEQVSVPIRYKALEVSNAYRLDMLIEEELIVELKAVDKIEPVHIAQMLTYLKVNGLRLGLLLNFNVEVLKKGIRRVVNNF